MGIPGAPPVGSEPDGIIERRPTKEPPDLELSVPLVEPLLLEGERGCPHPDHVLADRKMFDHPATGDGLGMAVTGGVMAAEMALAGKADAYPRAWKRRYRSRLRWGRLLHRAMLRPRWSRWACAVSRFVPWLAGLAYRKTREPVMGFRGP